MGRENRRLALFGKACVIALHPVRRVLHHGFTGMRVDIEREQRGCVSHERLHRLDVRAGRDRNCRECVPLRYNNDKPEKPRNFKGLEVYQADFSSFSNPKNQATKPLYRRGC